MQYNTTIWLALAGGCILLGCTPSRKTAGNQRLQPINERPVSPIRIDSITPGIPVYQASAIQYQRYGKTVMNIRLQEPVVVSVASKPEKWGYFQFPGMERKDDNELLIRWSLNDDAMEAYGSHKFGESVSTDGGQHWQYLQNSTFQPMTGLVLPNGDKISIHTPKPIAEKDASLPAPIGKGRGDTYSRVDYTFYKLHDLPANLKGAFIDRLVKGSSVWKTANTAIDDPQAARYMMKGFLPVVWWGDMHIAADGSIIAGIYPGFVIKENGEVDPRSDVFFYRSVDGGHSWKIQGRIPYVADLNIDPNGLKRMGYTEPAFEILADGTYLCVLRTTDGIGNGPMYSCRSSDLGVTWTKPEVMTPSGVMPRLLQLKNGVTVMASGRPGVQLRFSNDGKGKVWTDAFEMLPYINYKDQVSCGYTSLLETGADRFLIVYSDFKFINEAKEVRKAIKVREVIVTPE